MKTQHQNKFPLLRSFAVLLILSLLLPNYGYSQVYNFVEDRPPKVFPISTTSPRSAIDLDYPRAFDVTIKAFNHNESSTGFCEPFPSKITTETIWTGPVNPSEVKEVNNPDNTPQHSYDNIDFYKGYYFVLDSVTFQIIATQDFSNQNSYQIIQSELKNDIENQEVEDTYMIIDTEGGILFVVTRKKLISYNLEEFLKAVKEGKSIPKLKNLAPNYKGYEMLAYVQYYRHRLYIVADNIVEVFVLDGEAITPQVKFDPSFFDSEEVSISGIAFKGNYAYVLDRIKGIYVVDISKVDMVDESNLKMKYKFMSEKTKEIAKGQFIEIIGNSIHIVSAGTKSPFMFEFMIRGDPELIGLELNRKTDLFQSVRDTYSDSNFLYLVTGFFNMVTKHSIPGRYHADKVNGNLVEYWPLFGAKALSAQSKGSVSTVAAIKGSTITIIKFSEANPYISCNTVGVSEGTYIFTLHAILPDCDAKRKNKAADYNSICEINQDLEIAVFKDSGTFQSALDAKKTAFYLMIGIGILASLILVFLCLSRKYKNDYKRLYSQIRSQNGDEELFSSGKNTLRDNNIQVDSQSDSTPQNYEDDGKAHKAQTKSPSRPAPARESPTKNNNKPNAEFGGLKPLDIEGIYGSNKNQQANDDSF